MAAILEDGKLRLSGYVGDSYFDDGFTSSDVVVALAGAVAGRGRRRVPRKSLKKSTRQPRRSESTPRPAI